MRVNLGPESGYVIAFVPGNTEDPAHPQYIDLAQSRIWFGSPDLPERVAQLHVASYLGVDAVSLSRIKRKLRG